jgi:hypothetical protein
MRLPPCHSSNLTTAEASLNHAADNGQGLAARWGLGRAASKSRPRGCGRASAPDLSAANAALASAQAALTAAQNQLALDTTNKAPAATITVDQNAVTAAQTAVSNAQAAATAAQAAVTADQTSAATALAAAANEGITARVVSSLDSKLGVNLDAATSAALAAQASSLQH